RRSVAAKNACDSRPSRSAGLVLRFRYVASKGFRGRIGSCQLKLSVCRAGNLPIFFRNMWVVIALIALKLAAELYLAALNRRNVRAHANAVPDAFRGFVDAETYAKSVRYTLAKDQLNRWEMLFDAAVLIL